MKISLLSDCIRFVIPFTTIIFCYGKIMVRLRFADHTFYASDHTFYNMTIVMHGFNRLIWTQSCFRQRSAAGKPGTRFSKMSYPPPHHHLCCCHNHCHFLILKRLISMEAFPYSRKQSFKHPFICLGTVHKWRHHRTGREGSAKRWRMMTRVS